tara:strand:- start:1332 stop:1673 length:342 start_codon:yes stop_codon:yes gene_type:complete
MSSSVSAYVSLVEWFCDRCGDKFDENDCVDYHMEEGERVPSACDLDCYPEVGHTGHDDYGLLCDDCYDLVENPYDEDEPISCPDRLLAMKKRQREVINGHLENLVKIAEVQHG